MSLQTYYSVIGPWDLVMCFLAPSFNSDQYTLGPRPWPLWWSYSSPEFLIFGEIFFFFFNDMWLLECLPSIFGNHFSHPWGGFPGATFGHSWLRQSQIPYSQWTNQISALGSWSFGSMGPETGMLTNKVILMAAWRRRLMSLRTPRWWQISPLQNKNWVCLSSLE